MDRNTGGVVRDQPFGTYAEELPGEPVEYGASSLINSAPGPYPVKLTLWDYGDIFKDISRPGPLSYRLKHLWGPLNGKNLLSHPSLTNRFRRQKAPSS